MVHSCPLGATASASLHLDGSVLVTVSLDEWREGAALTLRYANRLQALRDVVGATLVHHKPLSPSGDALEVSLGPTPPSRRAFTFTANTAKGANVQMPEEIACAGYTPRPPHPMPLWFFACF